MLVKPKLTDVEKFGCTVESLEKYIKASISYGNKPIDIIDGFTTRAIEHIENNRPNSAVWSINKAKYIIENYCKK